MINFQFYADKLSLPVRFLIDVHDSFYILVQRKATQSGMEASVVKAKESAARAWFEYFIAHVADSVPLSSALGAAGVLEPIAKYYSQRWPKVAPLEGNMVGFIATLCQYFQARTPNAFNGIFYLHSIVEQVMRWVHRDITGAALTDATVPLREMKDMMNELMRHP